MPKSRGDVLPANTWTASIHQTTKTTTTPEEGERGKGVGELINRVNNHIPETRAMRGLRGSMLRSRPNTAGPILKGNHN